MKSPSLFFRTPACLLSLTVLFAGVFSSNAPAASFTGEFTFTSGSAGNIASYPYNGTAIPDVTVGNLNKVGVTSSSVNGGFGGRGWGTGAIDAQDALSGTIDLGKYIEFTITATPGTFINLTSLDFGVSRQGTGPRQFEWRSSADGFAAPISEYSAANSFFTDNNMLNNGVLTAGDVSTTWVGNTLNLSAPTYQGLSEITFRYYAYNAESASGIGGLGGPITFTGSTVSAVPEPSAIALAAIGGLLGLAFYRRNKLSA